MSAANTALSSLRPARQRNRLGVSIRSVQMSISIDSVSHLLDQRRRAGPTFATRCPRKMQKMKLRSRLLRLGGAYDVSREPLESSGTQKPTFEKNEQPHAVYWQTSPRPGRRARYATVNRRLLGATKAPRRRAIVRAAGRGLLAGPAQKSRARGAKPTHRQPEAATAPPAINQTKAPQPRRPENDERSWASRHHHITTRRRRHQYH